MMLIFESLEMILLRTASDLSHFSMVGNAIVKKTVSGHMKLLQASFHSENHRLASAGGLWKVSLWYFFFLTSAPMWCRLLCTGLFASASASCQLWCLRVQKLPENSWAAFTSIKLFQGWQRERIRRCVLFYFFPPSVCSWVVTFSKYACLHFSQGKPDVRMAFIQFVLSFLVSGDGTAVGQILEIKGSIYLCFFF